MTRGAVLLFSSVCVSLGLGLAACKDKPAGAGSGAPSASASGAAVAATAIGAGPSAEPNPVRIDGGQTARLSHADEARRIVRAWSEALDRHDVDALAKLYAPRVVFYTQEKSRDEVLAAKRAALGPSSKFKQSIVSDLDVASTTAGYVVTFTKKSGPADKQTEVKATVVVAGDPLAITEERDAPTDAKSADSYEGRCGSAASEVAQSLPEVKKILASTEAELGKHPGRHIGGIGPTLDPDGSVFGSLGVHTEQRYELLVGYHVAPDGKLEVTVPSHGPDPLKVPPADAAKVAAACKRR